MRVFFTHVGNYGPKPCDPFDRLNGDQVPFQNTLQGLFVSTQAKKERKIERLSHWWRPSVFSKYSTKFICFHTGHKRKKKWKAFAKCFFFSNLFASRQVCSLFVRPGVGRQRVKDTSDGSPAEGCMPVKTHWYMAEHVGGRGGECGMNLAVNCSCQNVHNYICLKNCEITFFLFCRDRNKSTFWF